MDDLMEKLQALLSDDESLGQLNDLAAMLQGELSGSDAEAEPATGEGAASTGGDFDFAKLLQIGQLFGNTQGDDKNAALLLALRPHLSTERQAKVDRALKLLKLYAIWTILKDSGMLEDML